MTRALVIGANGCIGAAIVKELSNRYDVATLSQRDTDYTQTGLQAKYDELKVGDSFSLIICCLGVLHNDLLAPEKRLSQLNEDKLAEYFRINAILPALCLRFMHKLLDKQNASKFVFLSAMVGSIGDNKLGGWYGYRSSKAALNMMIKTASVEIARSNKQACLAAIHPGTTQGPLSKPFAGGVSKDKYYTPEQSAKRIINLAESLNSEQTGSFFNWDGSILPW